MTRTRNRSGQTTTEYMILISVIVIAVVAAAYVFIPSFKEGVRALGDDVSIGLESGDLRPDQAGGGGGGGGGGPQ